MEDTTLSYAQNPIVEPYLYCTIPDRLRKYATDTPEKAAFIIHLVSGSRDVVTCKDVYTESVTFAKGLVHLGINKGDTVGVSFPNSREWLVSTFGIQLAGAVPLYMTYNYKDGRDIIPLLQHTGNCRAIIMNQGDELVDAIVTSCRTETDKIRVKSDLLPILEFVIVNGQRTQTCMTFTDVLGYGTLSKNKINLPEIDPDEVAAFLLTSGSTGLPKLVSKTHLQILTMGQRFTSAIGIESSDIYFNDRLFQWVAGYPVVYLISGAVHVTSSDQFTLNSVKEICDLATRIMKIEKSTVALLLPAFILELLTRKETEFHLRTITAGGVPVPKECSTVVGRFADEFIAGYGSTEINTASVKKVKKPMYSSYCIGRPCRGVEMKVVDSGGNIVQRNHKGELFVRHRIAFNGYYDNDAKTKKVLDVNGWYKTDDSAYMDETGDFYVTGRCSDIILCYGELISPSIIEEQIRKHPSVADVCVVPISDPICFQKVCACIVLRSNCSLNEDELRMFLSLNKRLNIRFNEKSRVYLFFDSFPKTAVGKIFRKGLKEAANRRLNEQ